MLDTEAPIACTLDATSLTARLAWIRDLQKRALIGHRRDGATLILNFEAAAKDDVLELVRRERECCAFLDFAVSAGAGEIEVKITVPPAAERIAEETLACFIPDAAVSPARTCCCG